MKCPLEWAARNTLEALWIKAKTRTWNAKKNACQSCGISRHILDYSSNPKKASNSFVYSFRQLAFGGAARSMLPHQKREDGCDIVLWWKNGHRILFALFLIDLIGKVACRIAHFRLWRRRSAEMLADIIKLPTSCTVQETSNMKMRGLSVRIFQIFPHVIGASALRCTCKICRTSLLEVILMDSVMMMMMTSCHIVMTSGG